MSHQQLVDGGLVLAGIAAMALFGLLESVVRGWLRRRRDRAWQSRFRRFVG